MNTPIQTIAARILAANDARLEGRITRAHWAGLIATFEIEMAEAGITWADVERACVRTTAKH